MSKSFSTASIYGVRIERGGATQREAASTTTVSAGGGGGGRLKERRRQPLRYRLVEGGGGPLDGGQDLLRSFGQGKDGHLLRTDPSPLHSRLGQPLEQPLPVVPPDEDHREGADLVGLDQGGRFEELIQRPESPRQEDERDGGPDKHDLPDEEVAEVQEGGNIRVDRLLQRELDVQSDGGASPFPRPLLCRLHNPGSRTGQDGEPVLGQEAANPLCDPIVWVLPGRPG